MARPAQTAAARTRDLARGWTLLGFWAAPVALLLVVSAVGPLLHLGSVELGSLLIVGTLWFGLSCLANALRCNRAHCWVDGTALPVLAAVGALDLLGLVTVSWDTYLSVLWGIVIASFVLECVTGSYLPLGSSRVP